MGKVRKIPVLASIISLVMGVGSAFMLLKIFHVFGSTHLFNQQSVVYRLLNGAATVCDLIGAILLWRMRPMAFRFFLASLLLDLYPDYVFYGQTTPHRLKILLIGMLLGIAVCAYTYYVTSRWQRGRPEVSLG